MAGTGAMRKRIIELEKENAALKAELACRGAKPANLEKAPTRYTYGLEKTSEPKE